MEMWFLLRVLEKSWDVSVRYLACWLLHCPYQSSGTVSTGSMPGRKSGRMQQHWLSLKNLRTCQPYRRSVWMRRYLFEGCSRHSWMSPSVPDHLIFHKNSLISWRHHKLETHHYKIHWKKYSSTKSNENSRP